MKAELQRCCRRWRADPYRGNGKRSLRSNHLFLIRPGPLPEPVVNGEMEEKVRALSHQSGRSQPCVSWSFSFEAV